MHTVIPLQSHCVSQMDNGIMVGYIPLSSSKTKYMYIGVIHPTASSSETLPVFLLQCFHRKNGWNHSGVRNFNPFHSVLLPTGMGGELKNPLCCTVCLVVTRINLLKIHLFSFHGTQVDQEGNVS